MDTVGTPEGAFWNLQFPAPDCRRHAGSGERAGGADSSGKRGPGDAGVTPTAGWMCQVDGRLSGNQFLEALSVWGEALGTPDLGGSGSVSSRWSAVPRWPQKPCPLPLPLYQAASRLEILPVPILGLCGDTSQASIWLSDHSVPQFPYL